MRYLVDTHILLWWVSNSKRLKDSVKRIIANPKNRIYASVASGLEIKISCACSVGNSRELPIISSKCLMISAAIFNRLFIGFGQ